jgi:hypothetical protein
MNAGRHGLGGEGSGYGGHLAELMRAEAELLSSHDTHQVIAGRLGIPAGLVRSYCNNLVKSARLNGCTHAQYADGKSEQPPPSDWFGRQDPRQGQGQPQYPPPPQSWSQQPRQPSFTADPQYAPSYGPPLHPAQPYQAQPPYPQEPYGLTPYPQGQPPYGPESYSPRGHRQQSYQQVPYRRRRRVFLWVFLAIQALFVIWIIAAVATVHTAPTQAQIAQGCYNHNWYPLFKSQADCVQHYGGALNDAGTAGKAIGVGLVIVFWMIVDVILGVSYGVYRLATRSRNSSVPGPRSSYPGEQPAWAPSGRSAPKSWPGRRKILTALVGFSAFWFIVAVTIVAVSGRHGPAASTAAQAPEASPLAASSSPAARNSPAAAAPAAARTVATFSGSGIENTPRFTVTATWKLIYSFNCSAFGYSGNFQVYEDGGSDFNGVSVNDLAMSKSATTWAYGDAGTHYLQVNSECAWEMKVVDEP